MNGLGVAMVPSLRLLLVVVPVLSISHGVFAEAAQPKWYTIAMVTGTDGTVSHEVLESPAVAARKAELQKQYQTAAAEWRKTKAGKRPSMPSLVAVKQVRGEEEAQKVIAEIKAKHSVVMIKGVDGKAVYEPVQSLSLQSRKTVLDAEYETALKEYEAGKKEALESGEKFTDKKPYKPSLIVVCSDLKDRAAADAYIAKLSGKKK